MPALFLAALLLLASCASLTGGSGPTPAEPSLPKMTQCYKKLDGFALREGYWIFPAERGGKYGFYAFNEDSAYFTVFPVDPVVKIKSRFSDFTGEKSFGNKGPATRYYAVQWTLPDKKPAWFWLDVDDADMTASHFGQASSPAGKFQEAVATKLPEGTKERVFTGAFHDHLVSLLISHTGRYHHAFGHRQPGPTRKQYFDQLDTCASAFDGKMAEAIQLEKQLVQILDEVAVKRPAP